jgi:hypothetical protein
MSSSIIDYLDTGKYVNDKNESIRSLVLKDNALTVGSALTVDVSGKVVSSSVSNSNSSFFSALQNSGFPFPNLTLNSNLIFQTVQPDSFGSPSRWGYNAQTGVLTVIKGGLFLINVNVLVSQNNMNNAGTITVGDNLQTGGAYGAVFPDDFTGITGPLSYSRVVRIPDNTDFAVKISNNKSSGILLVRCASWTLTQLSS